MTKLVINYIIKKISIVDDKIEIYAVLSDDKNSNIQVTYCVKKFFWKIYLTKSNSYSLFKASQYGKVINKVKDLVNKKLKKAQRKIDEHRILYVYEEDKSFDFDKIKKYL